MWWPDNFQWVRKLCLLTYLQFITDSLCIVLWTGHLAIADIMRSPTTCISTTSTVFFVLNFKANASLMRFLTSVCKAVTHACKIKKSFYRDNPKRLIEISKRMLMSECLTKLFFTYLLSSLSQFSSFIVSSFWIVYKWNFCSNRLGNVSQNINVKH